MSQTIALTGAFNLESRCRLEREVGEAPQQGDVCLDLSAVTEVDSVAIGLLLQWLRASQAAGHRLSLQGMPPSLASLADLYGVSDLLPAA